MDAIKVGKIVVPAVEDVVSTFLQRDMRHCLGIMDRSCRNMNKSRHLRFNIIKRMHLDTAFLPSEFRPVEDCETKVNRSGVEGIDIPSELEDFGLTLAPCLVNHVVGELLEDTEVALLVGFAKIAPRHGLPHAEMIQLSAVRLGGDNQVPKALAIGKLTEHHHK